MAQLVERVLGKDEVGGSNPPSSSKKTTIHWGGRFFGWIKTYLGGFEGGSVYGSKRVGEGRQEKGLQISQLGQLITVHWGAPLKAQIRLVAP